MKNGFYIQGVIVSHISENSDAMRIYTKCYSTLKEAVNAFHVLKDMLDVIDVYKDSNLGIVNTNKSYIEDGDCLFDYYNIKGKNKRKIKANELAEHIKDAIGREILVPIVYHINGYSHLFVPSIIETKKNIKMYISKNWDNVPIPADGDIVRDYFNEEAFDEMEDDEL